MNQVNSNPPSHEASAGQRKVLIVEDDKDFLWILRQSLFNHGVAIVSATDGQEGLDMAQKEKPDLILIDIDLPKMNGIEMAKEIRKIDKAVLMIFLTNLKDAQHISEAIDIAGQADYIVKTDVRMDAIVLMVKEKLGLKD